MNTKAFSPSGEGSNLILGVSTENQIFFLRTQALSSFFTKLSKNDTLASLGGGGIMGASDDPQDGGHLSNSPVMKILKY